MPGVVGSIQATETSGVRAWRDVVPSLGLVKSATGLEVSGASVITMLVDAPALFVVLIGTSVWPADIDHVRLLEPGFTVVPGV